MVKILFIILGVMVCLLAALPPGHAFLAAKGNVTSFAMPGACLPSGCPTAMPPAPGYVAMPEMPACGPMPLPRRISKVKQPPVSSFMPYPCAPPVSAPVCPPPCKPPVLWY